MSEKLIYGIQQIGVGVADADQTFEWYATRLGSDVPVFEDDNTATFMAPYMGGKPREKRAILAMNLEGGSGYEIWQYTNRTPSKPENPFRLGDLGINGAIVKSRNITQSFDRLQKMQVEMLTNVVSDIDGTKCFYINDLGGNLLKIKESNSWFSKSQKDLGGVYGGILGVSNIEEAMKLYSDVLGYDQVLADETGSFESLKGIANGDATFRRVILGHKANRTGGFSKLLGDSQLELVQMIDKVPEKLFKNRYWGDLGFIHLCFDISNMRLLTEECKAKGFPFKVLSSDSFDMGDANGHWGYIEDPDGTLIEFVETHKVSLVKPLNWNINLRNRDPKKPLPNWLVKAMSFKRKKFN